MRRTIATLVLMAGALAPAISASAQQDARGVGIRLLEAPTARQNDPRAQRSIVDHMKPGTSISRKFEVKNTTSSRRVIKIYAAGADVRGGEFVTADGNTQNEVSRWVSIDTTSADLGPQQAVQPRLTITVPGTASEGERYAVVWAELPPATPPGGGVAVVNRVGLRIYLSVGKGGEPPTDFTIESLTAERDADSRPVVSALIHNTGGRALDLSGSLNLTNSATKVSAGPFPAALGTTLAIGATEPVRIVLDTQFSGGPWHAVLSMKSSTTERKAEADITFPEGANATASPVPAHEIGKSGGVADWLVPAVLGVLGLLVVGLLLFLVFKRRKREDTPPAPPPPPAAAPVPAPVPAAPPPSLDAVLEELATATGARRDELMTMAVSHGSEAIMRSPRLSALPVDTARELGQRVAKSGR
jgi:hypothetical protein